MVDEEEVVDALMVTEQINPEVAREIPKHRGDRAGRIHSSLTQVCLSLTEDISKLVPSKDRTDLEAAKDTRPKYPQHVPAKSDDVGVAQDTA